MNVLREIWVNYLVLKPDDLVRFHHVVGSSFLNVGRVDVNSDGKIKPITYAALTDMQGH